MKQGTMNILFFVLKTKLLKNGEAPVLMRITINGDYDDARIQRSVPLNLWNAAKGCSKGRDRASVALNTYIAELHARALEKHKELVLEQALITPKLILKRVFGKDTGMRTLLGTMQEGIEEMESQRRGGAEPPVAGNSVINFFTNFKTLRIWHLKRHLSFQTQESLMY